MGTSCKKPRMCDWVDEYVRHLQKQSKAPHTIRCYLVALERFAYWWDQSRRSPRSVRRVDLINFWEHTEHLAGWNPKGNSLINYAGYVNRFLKWAETMEYLRSAPHYDTTGIQVEEVELVRMDPVDMGRMLASIEEPRDRIAVALSVHAGPRLSEITGLTWEQVHLEAGYINFYNQKKRRTVRKKITPGLDRELRKWMTLYPTLTGKPCEPEFFVVPGRRPDPNRKGGWLWSPTTKAASLGLRFRQYTEPFIGRVHRQGGSHTLRRSAAQAIVMAAPDPEVGLSAAQHMLDHRNRSQTEKYVGLKLNQRIADKLLEHDFIPDVEAVTQLRRPTDGEGQSETQVV